MNELNPGDPIPPEQTGGMEGFVVGECGHRIARSEWAAGFRVCERCAAHEAIIIQALSALQIGPAKGGAIACSSCGAIICAINADDAVDALMRTVAAHICGDGESVPPVVTYKFDQLAVLTYDVITAAGLDAARNAANALITLADGGVIEYATAGYFASDVQYELRCIATRGPVFLVETEPETGAPFEDVGEPLAGDVRRELRAALAEADAALSGDSNDAEHDALYSIRETLAGILGGQDAAPTTADEAEIVRTEG